MSSPIQSIYDRFTLHTIYVAIITFIVELIKVHLIE